MKLNFLGKRFQHLEKVETRQKLFLGLFLFKLSCSAIFEFSFIGWWSCLIPLAAAMVWWRKGLWLGYALLFIKALSVVVMTFPLTINHHFIELLLITVMVLLEPRQGKLSSAMLAKLRVNVVALIYLLVWFYSGVHKIVHGKFIDGEFLALYGLSETGGLGYNLHWPLKNILALVHLTPTSIGPCCFQGSVALNSWEMVIFPLLGSLIVIAEVLFPLLYLLPRMQKYIFPLFIFFQTGITFSSMEIDFGLTCGAFLAALLPTGKRNWALLVAMNLLFYLVFFYDQLILVRRWW